MSMYDGLRDRLRAERLSEIILSFSEIEELIGVSLPKSALRPQWWPNERSLITDHSQRNAWRDAGYDAFLIKDARKVRFKKVH